MYKKNFAVVMCCLLMITATFLSSSCRKKAIEKAEPAGGSAQKLFSGASNSIEQFYLYLPKDYYTANKQYPVIIFLHGNAQRTSGNINSLTQVGVPLHALTTGEFPFIVIAPLLKQTVDTWVVSDLDRMYNEVINRYRIDRSRVNLSGFSIGATSSWIWASSRNDIFASVNPIGGSTDSNPCNLVRIPLWAFHNRFDTIFSVDQVQRAVDQLNTCGGNAKLTIYDDGGHEGWTKAYQDPALYDWIAQQQKR